MKESEIQKKIQFYLSSKGWYVVKVIVASKAGIPDILACSIKGEFYAFEVKKPGGVVSPLQQYNIDTITGCKGKAYVVDSLDQVKKIIEINS